MLIFVSKNETACCREKTCVCWTKRVIFCGSDTSAQTSLQCNCMWIPAKLIVTSRDWPVRELPSQKWADPRLSPWSGFKFGVKENTFLGDKIFVPIICMFKTNYVQLFAGTTKCGGNKRIWGSIASECFRWLLTCPRLWD